MRDNRSLSIKRSDQLSRAAAQRSTSARCRTLSRTPASALQPRPS